MNSQITGLRVASVVFGLIAIPQLVRLVIRPEVLVAGYSMPMWPSVLALIILGGLSISMWKLARTSSKVNNSRDIIDPVVSQPGRMKN
jgi:hypothetical protein